MRKEIETIVKPRIFLSWGIFDAYSKLQGSVPYSSEMAAREFVAKTNEEIKKKNPQSREQYYVARIKNPVVGNVQLPAIVG